jgi:hypothetical protein
MYAVPGRTDAGGLRRDAEELVLVVEEEKEKEVREVCVCMHA